MKSKVFLCVLVMLGLTAGQVWAQEFDLGSFADDIEELMHKLEIGEKEMDRSIEIYKELNKSLLNLNQTVLSSVKFSFSWPKKERRCRRCARV